MGCRVAFADADGTDELDVGSVDSLGDDTNRGDAGMAVWPVARDTTA